MISASSSYLQNTICFFLLLVLSVHPYSYVIPTEPDPIPFIPTEGEPMDDLTTPEIYEMSVNSEVTNRYATTVVTSKFRNTANRAQEAVFAVVLPETAFISEFVMEVHGKMYKAYVMKKEEAENVYIKAVNDGLSAAHVTARGSNKFTISVNVEPKKKAIFKVTYEELLQRKEGKYEIVLNIHPGQIVPNLDVVVNIKEHLPLDFVRTPSIRSGKEIGTNSVDDLRPNSEIQRTSPSSATIKFHPNKIEQGKFGDELGAKENEGLNGQFVVEYDVQRDGTDGGEVLLNNGYFVHFFAPDKLEAMPKHMVFVLDISGSMYGREMKQLCDAMEHILKDLTPDDIFSIIVFQTTVKVWDQQQIHQFLDLNLSFRRDYGSLKNMLEQKGIPYGTSATKLNISAAISAVKNLRAQRLTNIIGGLEVGLYIAQREQENGNDFHQPLLVFLTDGKPNVGVTNSASILRIVSRLNNCADKIPIYSLSFGDHPDKSFLRDLSSANQGFSRHIYKASDASLQLKNFYNEISVPILKDVTFKYLDNTGENRGRPEIFFCGTEFVHAGKLPSGFNHSFFMVEGHRSSEKFQLTPKVANSPTSLERLWAFLTVRQILNKRDDAANKSDLTKEATDLALKYSFVTPVTSLVVVKPDEKVLVEPENIHNPPDTPQGLPQLPISYNVAMPRLISNNLLQSSYPMLARESFPNLLPNPVMVGPSCNFKDVPSCNLKDLPVPLPELQQQEWFRALRNGPFLIHLVNDYKLATNETVVSRRRCPKTISNTDGVCTLIHECPRAIPFLTDLQSFAKYFCPVEGYAGICCDKLA